MIDVLKVTHQGAAPVWCGCRVGCAIWDAYLRHLANATEPFVSGGDAALCQITLTTCLLFDTRRSLIFLKQINPC